MPRPLPWIAFALLVSACSTLEQDSSSAVDRVPRLQAVPGLGPSILGWCFARFASSGIVSTELREPGHPVFNLSAEYCPQSG